MTTTQFKIITGFVMIALLSSCMHARPTEQISVTATQELTISEKLATRAPVTMAETWDYIINTFGQPMVQRGIIRVESRVYETEGIFHVQFMTNDGSIFHEDRDLDSYAVGGAQSDDEALFLAWVCPKELVRDEYRCTLPLASEIFAYDRTEQAALWWPRRLDQ